MANAKAAYGKIAAPRRLEALLEGNRDEYLPGLLIILAILTAVSIFHVWSRVKVVEYNLQLGESRKQIREMRQEHSRLKIEVASLKNPARIEMLAHHELGLSMPTNQQVVQVK